MQTPKTNHPTPVILDDAALEEIEARITKLPEGPWFAAFDRAKECGPHRDSGLALVDTGRESDWPIARLCEWHAAKFIAASITDIPALCQTVRALRAEISTLKGHWADTSEDLASAWEKHGELESTNTALREQLAEAQKNLRIRRDLIRGWQRHVQRMAAMLNCEALDIKVEHAAGELQSRLAALTEAKNG